MSTCLLPCIAIQNFCNKMVVWTVVMPTASVCRVFLSGNSIWFFNQLLTVYINTAFLNQQSNNIYNVWLWLTLFALLLNIKWFFTQLFTKANVLPNVIKISCARGRHNMPPPFYTARCGPARLTPAGPLQRALLPVAVCTMNIHNVRDRQTSDAHYRSMSAPFRGGGILNERVQLSALLTSFKTSLIGNIQIYNLLSCMEHTLLIQGTAHAQVCP